jgi:hypothetical protein
MRASMMLQDANARGCSVLNHQRWPRLPAGVPFTSAAGRICSTRGPSRGEAHLTDVDLVLPGASSGIRVVGI